MLTIGLDEALDQLKQGKIDAMFYVAGYPVKLFSENITAEDNLALIPITDKSILEFYPQSEIPANTYAWQDKAVETVAVKAVLISYNFRRFHCENVGRMAKLIYEKPRLADPKRTPEMEIRRPELPAQGLGTIRLREKIPGGDQPADISTKVGGTQPGAGCD